LGLTSALQVKIPFDTLVLRFGVTLFESGEHKVTIRIVRLGSSRQSVEGVRIGTVRRPPRGVPKAQFAKQNWYDVWFPNLAPSAATMKLGLGAVTEKQWNTFAKKYRAEMSAPDARRTLDVLAALSHQSNFSVGCYCESEARCHRSILRELLTERGARLGMGSVTQTASMDGGRGENAGAIFRYRRGR